MEKHHKLRRPAGASTPDFPLLACTRLLSLTPRLRAGSSIHGCNICGKEGHQAAHCSNGTVDWGSKWPKDAWSLEEPLWYAEPQYAVVGKVARDWVAKRKRQAAAAAAAASGEVRTRVIATGLCARDSALTWLARACRRLPSRPARLGRARVREQALQAVVQLQRSQRQRPRGARRLLGRRSTTPTDGLTTSIRARASQAGSSQPWEEALLRLRRRARLLLLLLGHRHDVCV